MGRIGTAVRAVGLAVLALTLVVGGGFAVGIFGVPSAGLVDRGDWGTVTDDRITVETTYYVDNPNPVGLTSEGATVEYELALNDVALANGTKEGVAVPAGNTTDTVTTTIRQDRLPAWWRSHVRRGERSTVRVGLNATVPAGPVTLRPSHSLTRNVSTNVTGTVERSLGSYEGDHPEATPVVEVRDVQARWGTQRANRTPMLVTFVVHNPNPTVLPVPAFAGNLSGNDVVLARWNASELQVRDAPDDGTIGPGETDRITYAARLRSDRLDEWLTSHVRNEERTNLTMTSALAVTYGDRTYTVPNEGGIECHGHLQTAIFVDNQTSSGEFEDCRPAPPGVAATARSGAQSFASDDGIDWGALTNDSTGGDGTLGDGTLDDGTFDDGLTTVDDPLGGGDDGGATATATPTEDAGEATPTPTDDGGVVTTLEDPIALRAARVESHERPPTAEL